MKDIAQIAILVVIIWGCMIAAPIFGMIIGCVGAAWFLLKAGSIK
jgi:hypothetical protein